MNSLSLPEVIPNLHNLIDIESQEVKGKILLVVCRKFSELQERLSDRESE